MDIEGAEYQILSNLNWSKLNISALSVEINHAGEIFLGNRQDIHDLLKNNQFKFVETCQIDDIFVHKTNTNYWF